MTIKTIFASSVAATALLSAVLSSLAYAQEIADAIYSGGPILTINLKTTYFAGIYGSINRAYDATRNQNRGTYPKG
jgi:hypothetical protein